MEDFLFIPGFDSIGDDICRENFTIQNDCSEFPNILRINITKSHKECIAFNTLGFVKKRVNKLQKIDIFSEKGGIYVKNVLPQFPIKIVNLDRRNDRWKSAEKKLQDQGIGNYERFSAVDGYQLTLTDSIKHLFRNNDFNYRCGVIGCGLSHYTIWQELLQSQSDYFIVLEDDSDLVPDFKNKLNVLLNQILQDPIKDIVFLGYSIWNGKPEVSQEYPVIQRMNNSAYKGGTFGYVISKAAAWKLLHIAKIKGIQNGIDWFMLYNFNTMVTCNTTPHLVHSELFSNENRIDTDIQNSNKCLTETVTPNKIIKFKILCNWESKTEDWYSFSKNGKGSWNNIQVTNDEPDYFLIINSPKPGDKYDPKRTIVTHMEPWVYDSSKNWGVKTWGEWSNPDPNKFFKVLTHKYHHNISAWMIKKSYPELINTSPIKNKMLSTIVSQKNFDEGHIKRIEFLKYFENKTQQMFLDKRGVFNLSIDIYGRGSHLFRNNKGALGSKNDGVLPYKYHIAVENNAENNYFTEKITDGILSECLCFYWGCPNLEEYIDSRAFIRLSFDNFEEDFETIVQAIESKQWEERIEYIKEAKKKILNELSLFPCIEKVLN
jgi:GR25 family glycosyltransferase involved in LPS biosynthesis